jgi:N-carbamoylputrescine amidase
VVIAAISEVFVGGGAEERLAARLVEAKRLGAEIALLPELPLNPWSPATRDARDEDAEPPGGPRHEAQRRAAKSAGLGLVGGAIVLDPGTGHRHNTALVFDSEGTLRGSYRKVHLPQEEGFFEADHYEPGDDAPEPIQGFSIPVGIQICSDNNRPEGTHLLGALGAEAVLAPRASESATFARWELVFRVNAMTSAVWIVSVNRPGPENGVPLGGPSILIAPDGEVVAKTTERLAIFPLDRGAVERARRDYPGYLATRAGVYAAGWTAAARRRR